MNESRFNLKKNKQSATALTNSKIPFCAPFVWKKLFFFKQSYVFQLAEKLIFCKSSIIPKAFTGLTVKIYSGKNWNEKKINRWMIGFRFGEFVWNRKIAFYKAKQLRKKKKK